MDKKREKLQSATAICALKRNELGLRHNGDNTCSRLVQERFSCSGGSISMSGKHVGLHDVNKGYVVQVAAGKAQMCD